MPIPADNENNVLVFKCPYCKEESQAFEPVTCGHGNRVRLPAEEYLIQAFRMENMVADGMFCICPHCQKRIEFKLQSLYVPVLKEE